MLYEIDYLVWKKAVNEKEFADLNLGHNQVK